MKTMREWLDKWHEDRTASAPRNILDLDMSHARAVGVMHDLLDAIVIGCECGGSGVYDPDGPEGEIFPCPVWPGCARLFPLAPPFGAPIVAGVGNDGATRVGGGAVPSRSGTI